MVCYFLSTKTLCYLPWPAFKGGNHKQCEHCVHDIVIMKGTSLPNSFFHNGLIDITVLVGDELSLASLVVVHAEVGAHEELALEELDTDHPEHEYQKHCHSHNVADRFH